MALNRALAHLAGIAATVLTASLLTAPVAQAAPPTYVALGDSYSSGTGTRSYIDDGTSCKRSTAAFPSLIAIARGYSLNFRACGGRRSPTSPTPSSAP
ncbi:hypothetical protein [Nocardioides houyundeii]|uniref:hypothetical protein n=1 Tax=Nocardioides houyundeii TaxID=2045452 RepID=UPI001F53A027|nr:hypothetical protein [Nocardioides houyundeii]